MNIDKPLTVEQLAEFLGLSTYFIYRQCRARLWPHARVARQIRFTAEHVSQILAEGEQAPISAPVIHIRSRRIA